MVLVKQNWNYAHEIGKMEKYDVAGVLTTQKVEDRAIHSLAEYGESRDFKVM